MNIPKLKPVKHYPAELRERVERFNVEAAAVEEGQTTVEARIVELCDPVQLTPTNAAARLKGIGKARVERLALLTQVRALAVEAAAMLAEFQASNNAETGRLTEAMRARECEIRHGLKALGITEELAVRRACIGDGAMNQIRGDAAQIGQGHRQVCDIFRDMLRRADAEIGDMLRK